jgi:hypothetical protein
MFINLVITVIRFYFVYFSLPESERSPGPQDLSAGKLKWPINSYSKGTWQRDGFLVFLFSK